MDFIIELLGEIFIEFYFELMILIVPDKKISKGWHIAAKVFALLMILGIVAAIVWGIVLIENGNLPLGIGIISAAAVVSLIQITLGIVFYNKNHVDE